MKKSLRESLLSLILVFLMVFVSACSSTTPTQQPTEEKPQIEEPVEEESGIFTPGTYEGEGDGFGGPIKVTVTVDELSIKSIVVVEENETLGIGTTAIEKMPKTMVEKQSTGIDGISGCTFSSFGLKAAVNAALEKSGVEMSLITKAPKKEEVVNKDPVTIETDIVVVGGGGSGLAAALTARQNGAEVVVLEKMAFLGGAMSISGSQVVGAGSEYQKAQGIEDSADLFYEDLLRNGHVNNEVLAKLYADNVGETFDWLVNDMGVKFGEMLVTPEYQAKRSAPVIGTSPVMAETLRENLKNSGADIYMETRATELIKEGDKIVGVKAESADGIIYEVKAKAVLLATGGFGNNREMLSPPYNTSLYYGPVSSTGDGHKMAMEVGAMTYLMEYSKIYPNGIEVAPGFAKSTFAASNAVFRDMSSILIDRSGNRVANESGPAAAVREVMLEQPDQTLFLLMDQANWEKFHETNKASNILTDKEADRWLANNGKTTPIFIKNDNIKAAAETAGIDGDALVATVERYNSFVAKGVDEDFGRKDKGLSMSIGEGPYYIVEQKPRYATTLGGLKTSTNFEVYDENEQPIPGLYAVGELVAGPQGNDSMPGANNGWAFTSGHTAGKILSELVK